jgi:hypothetical protein
VPLSSAIAGSLLVADGFLLRMWATYIFYEHRMKVISLSPQAVLVTSGPYRFSRNPLYLGGNVSVFFGAGCLLGSPSALVLTVLHLPLVDLFIRREETQLEARFGDQFHGISSTSAVPAFEPSAMPVCQSIAKEHMIGSQGFLVFPRVWVLHVPEQPFTATFASRTHGYFGDEQEEWQAGFIS